MDQESPAAICRIDALIVFFNTRFGLFTPFSSRLAFACRFTRTYKSNLEDLCIPAPYITWQHPHK
jgi:hypothetical protein